MFHKSDAAVRLPHLCVGFCDFPVIFRQNKVANVGKNQLQRLKWPLFYRVLLYSSFTSKYTIMLESSRHAGHPTRIGACPWGQDAPQPYDGELMRCLLLNSIHHPHLLTPLLITEMKPDQGLLRCQGIQSVLQQQG